MIFFAVAFGLLVHVLFWGAGLAILAMPRPWRRFWPVLAAPAGFALQSAVVWLGAYGNLPGTNRYAWWSELVPVILLALAVRRHGWKRPRIDISRFGLVWLAMAAALVALLLPLAIASRGLTTVSLGSCDAADYAAGARVFMEFARSDRSGFLGLTEVVRVMSADNFYDFWLRLNHFTPSALMALNGSILDCAPNELASIFTVVVLATGVPVVFWMARAVFGYSGVASLAIATLFGFSPIPWYSAAHVSPAPLLAAQAIALLNWAGIALWNGRLSWRRVAAFGGVLAIGYALVLGSYNFILVIALVPAVAYAGGRAFRTAAWPRLARWTLAMAVPFTASAAFFWGRIDGLVERFMLFQTYDFGWHIPVLWPDGWLGMVQGGSLHAWPWAPVHWVLAAVVLFALGCALARAMDQRWRRVWLVASVTLPVLVGYAYLELRSERLHTNASYDAFKLMTVFYPLLLPAFCWWVTLRWGGQQLLRWAAVVAFGCVVAAMNATGCIMYIVKLSRPPLIVGGELRQLRKVEAMPDVMSVNMLLPDMWSRLWANAFLLRKPQYFASHSYEGRLNTPLHGDWDLAGGIIRVQLDPAAMRALTPHYDLLDTRSRDFVRARFGEGWHGFEELRNGEQWRWMRQEGSIRVENPHAWPLHLHAILDVRSYGEREIAIGFAGAPPLGTLHVGPRRERIALPAIEVPPGRSRIVFRSLQSADKPPGDSRALTLCFFGITLRSDLEP
jgi:hypothetical protein